MRHQLPDDQPNSLRPSVVTPPYPRQELFRDATPLLPLRNFSASFDAPGGVRVWAKREDLLPLGLGGNKLRNMEFLLAEAVTRHSDRVVVFGRPGSNHCRLAAAAAAQLSLPTTVVMTGPRPPLPSINEQLIAFLGAQILYSEDAEPASAASLAERHLKALEKDGFRPYLIPPGASGTLGASGQVLAGLELAEQLRDIGVELDYVFVGLATGGTFTGLRVGLALAGLPVTVVGVPTHLALASSEADLVLRLEMLSQELVNTWACASAWARYEELRNIVIDAAPWHTYGDISPKGIEAAKRLGATEGILVDPIYTANVAASLIQWAERGDLDGKSAVLWVGGGIPAILAP